MREIKPTCYTCGCRGYLLLLLQQKDRGGERIRSNRVSTVVGPWQDLIGMFHRLFLKQMLPFLLALTIFGIFSPKSAVALTPSSEVNFKTRLFNSDDGLPQNRINCLKKTSDGYLWIGTKAGLARFDGNRFNVFNRDNMPELGGEAGDSINTLAQTPDGTLWIGTAQGLVSYKHHTFRRFTMSEGLPGNFVRRIVTSREGGLWLVVGDSATRFKENKVVWSTKIPDGLNYLMTIHESPNGGLDVLSRNAWITISSDGQTITTNLTHQKAQPAWRSAAFDQGDELLIGTDRGVFRLSDRTSPRLLAAGLDGEKVNYLARMSDGEFLAETEISGIYNSRTNDWPRNPLSSRVEGKNITSIIEDTTAGTWVGTDSGLLQIIPTFIKSFSQLPGLRENNVFAVCEDAAGDIWSAGENGVCRISEEGKKTTAINDPSFTLVNRSIWPDAKSGVWLCKKFGGLFKFENGQFEKRIEAEQFPGVRQVIIQDRSNHILIGCGKGLLRYDPRTSKLTDLTQTYPLLTNIRSLYEDRQGQLWAGCAGNRLAKLGNDQITSYTATNGLLGGFVYCINEDTNGTIWCATEKALCRVRDGRCVSLTQEHGVPETGLKCILQDDLGNLWLGGRLGVYRVDLAALNAVADGRKPDAQFIAFGTPDGMESPEVNGAESRPTGWKSRDGRLWFATPRGLAVIDPRYLNSNLANFTNPPAIVIEAVKADELLIYGHPAERSSLNANTSHPGQVIQRTSENIPIIPAGNSRVIEFQYTANAFVNPKAVRFRYRMNGVDSDWHEKTGERVVHYANLRPGNYTFEVISATHHNIWNTEPARFSFELAAHFWQTRWFYVLCGLVVMGLVFLIHTIRLSWQHRSLNLAEQKNLANERARIARDLHDDIGTALTGLALELDVIGKQGDADEALSANLKGSAQKTRDLANRMREVVWTANPACDSISSLADFIEQLGEQFTRGTDIRLRLDFPEIIPSFQLSPQTRHQLSLCIRESLTNVLRHAKATELLLRLDIRENELTVQVADNGLGFKSTATNGNGLKNMADRMKSIGGSFSCEPGQNNGTTVSFRLGIKEKACAP